MPTGNRDFDQAGPAIHRLRALAGELAELLAVVRATWADERRRADELQAAQAQLRRRVEGLESERERSADRERVLTAELDDLCGELETVRADLAAVAREAAAEASPDDPAAPPSPRAGLGEGEFRSAFARAREGKRRRPRWADLLGDEEPPE
jgi:hypothetical protein